MSVFSKITLCVLSILTALMLMGCCAQTLSCNISSQAQEYADCGRVIEVHEESGLIVYQTQSGNVFSFYDSSDNYSVGDLVALIMDDVGTSNVYDDIIISARYVGRFDKFVQIDEQN